MEGGVGLALGLVGVLGVASTLRVRGSASLPDPWLEPAVRPPAPQSMWRWGYHATSPEALPRIGREGLEGRHPEFGPVGQPRGVYFSVHPRHAMAWNTVLLRFPLPPVYEEDPAGEMVAVRLSGGGPRVLVNTGYVSAMGIGPDQIEVWTFSGWRSLTGRDARRQS